MTQDNHVAHQAERDQIVAYLSRVPQKYHTSNYLIAYYASFAEVFTPDMLYQLWLNFQTYYDQYTHAYQTIDMVAIADLLQSNMCTRIGYELYEMSSAIASYFRNLSLEEVNLKRNIILPASTPTDVTRFVLEYAKRYYKDVRYKHLYSTYCFKLGLRVAPQETLKELKNLLLYTGNTTTDARRHLRILIDTINTQQEVAPQEARPAPQLSHHRQANSIDLTPLLEGDKVLWEKLENLLNNQLETRFGEKWELIQSILEFIDKGKVAGAFELVYTNKKMLKNHLTAISLIKDQFTAFQLNNLAYVKYKFQSILLENEIYDEQMAQAIIRKELSVSVLLELINEAALSQVINVLDYMPLSDFFEEKVVRGYGVLKKEYLQSETYNTAERFKTFIIFLLSHLGEIQQTHLHLKHLDDARKYFDRSEIFEALKLLSSFEDVLLEHMRDLLHTLKVDYLYDTDAQYYKRLQVFIDKVRDLAKSNLSAQDLIQQALKNQDTSLDLSNQGIESLEDIPELTKCVQLQQLNLSNNAIEEMEDLGALRNLIELDLHNNNIKRIPRKQALYENLIYLDLSNNQITVIPTFVGNMSKLEKLFLFDNPINNIPKEVYNQDNCLATLRAFFEKRADNKAFNILLVASHSEKTTAGSAFDKELGYIQEHCQNFHIEALRQPGLEGLRERFPVKSSNEAIYNILHFSGCNNQAGIYLWDLSKEPKSQPLSVGILKKLFISLPIEQRPQVLFLNACASDDIIENLKTIIPYIIATAANISNSNALIFSNVFYQTLANDESITYSFRQARREAILKGTSEGSFVFYKEGQLFYAGKEYYDTLINSAADFEAAKGILENMKKSTHLSPDTFTYESLMSKAPDFEATADVHSEMKQNNVPASHKTYILLTAKSPHLETSMKLLSEMKQENITPTAAIYASIILKSSDFDTALDLFSDMRANNIRPDEFVYTGLISRSPDFETASRFFNEAKRNIPKVNAVVYTALINKSPDFETAMVLANEMIALKLQLNEHVYDTLIQKAPDFETAWTLFQDLLKRNALPKPYTYNNLIAHNPPSKTIVELVEEFLQKATLKEDQETMRLLSNLGQAYQDLEDFDKAEERFTQTLDFQQKMILMNPDNLTYQDELITAYVNLGYLYTSQGDFGKATQIFKKALVVQEKSHLSQSKNTPDYLQRRAYILHSLGSIYLKQNLFEKAEKHLQMSLKIREKLLVTLPQDIDIKASLALLYLSLGDLYTQQGEISKAEESLQRHLNIQKELCKQASNNAKFREGLAISYAKVGEFYQAYGAYTKAVSFFEKALAQTQVNMASGPKIAIAQTNLAGAYQFLGEYTKAKELLEAALEINLKNFGDQHPQVAIDQANLARVCHGLGEYNEAVNLFEAALQNSLEKFGQASNPQIAVIQANLAKVYYDLGEYHKAIDLFESALQINLVNFGKLHPQVAATQADLAQVYRDLGDYSKALELQTSALKNASSTLGETHPTTAVHQSNLAMIYQDLDNYIQAKELMQSALDIDLNSLGKEHPQTISSQSNLASIHIDLEEYDKAEELLKEVVKYSKVHSDEDHPDVAIYHNNLAHVYLATNRLGEAKKLLEKALGILKKTLGEQHPQTVKTKKVLAKYFGNG